MPRKTKTTAAADKAAQPQFSAELLEQLIPGPVTPAELEGIFQQFKKSVLERALGAELSHHLGYAPGQAKPEGGAANHRNGKSAKTVLTDAGALRIDIPRDRAGTFEPQLIGKHERRFTGFDDKIVAMYARGMTVREIQGFLAEMYSVDVSPELISRVTDEVMSEVTAWQTRPLEAMYPVVFFDALRVKIREDAVVRSKAVYLALGVLPDGSRDILGIWIENTEGAKFWMKVFNDLKTRGVQDILIAVTDGLKGMPEALGAVFPATTLQTCIVHLIRNSLDFASWKERKALAAAIKPIYTAVSAEAAEAELHAFEAGPWGQKFPTVVSAWRRAWDKVIPFFAFPPEVRRVIYTTNAMESVNARLRKIIKTRGHFPSDDAATKLIWLALRNITEDWGRAANHWKSAMNQFAILYEDRFTQPAHGSAAGRLNHECMAQPRGLRRPMRGEEERKPDPKNRQACRSDSRQQASSIPGAVHIAPDQVSGADAGFRPCSRVLRLGLCPCPSEQPIRFDHVQICHARSQGRAVQAADTADRGAAE